MGNNKYNKNKKQSLLSPEAKLKLRTGFATLINNEACVKASREWKGWWNLVPLGLALGAVCLAVTPTFVQRMNIHGGDSFMSSPTYQIEYGLETFSSELYSTNIDGKQAHIEIKDGTVVATNWEVMTPRFKWYQVFNNETNIVEFEVFINNSDRTDKEFMDDIVDCKDPYDKSSRSADSFFKKPINMAPKFAPEDSSAASNDTESVSSEVTSTTVTSEATSAASTSQQVDPWEKYHVNCLIFGKKGARMAKYPTSLKNASSSYIDINYAGINGTDFNKIGEKLATADKNYDPNNLNARVSLAKKLYTKLLNDGFEAVKQSQAWYWTGIMAGTYAGLIIIFGLVLFLLTRGKKNPYRVYNYFDTAKIACWASVAPAILSLLGFITATYSFFFFIVLYGLRIMWMTMKVFSPARQVVDK